MRTDLWQRGCERLASELPDQQFNTWIRPLPDADVNDEAETAVVTVRVPNRFKLDWIRNQYAGPAEAPAWPAPARPYPRQAAPASDRETLAALGATGVDDGAATARLHPDEEAVRACATDFGGLVGAFHVGFRGPAWLACGSTRRATRDYSKNGIPRQPGAWFPHPEIAVVTGTFPCG